MVWRHYEFIISKCSSCVQPLHSSPVHLIHISPYASHDFMVITSLREMYVMVQIKHERDVCIGSKMGEMYVLVQTWGRIRDGSHV